MKKILVKVFLSFLGLLVSNSIHAQNQSSEAVRPKPPVYEIGKIEIIPPVMIPGVTVADKNDIKPAATSQNSPGNTGNANVSLSTNVPVIRTNDAKQTRQK